MDLESVQDLIAALEKDLAAFYDKALKTERYGELTTALKFMRDSSSAHADKISHRGAEVSPGPMNRAPVIQIHEHIKKSLSAQLGRRTPPDILLRQMADTEGIIGQVYDKMAAHCRRLADHALRFSEAIQRMAGEERSHRNYLLGEILIHRATEGAVDMGELSRQLRTRFEALSLESSEHGNIDTLLASLELQAGLPRPEKTVVTACLRALVVALLARLTDEDAGAFLSAVSGETPEDGDGA